MAENLKLATELRDGMIQIARSLADRDCGAMQSEMRDAQIEFLGASLSGVEALVEALERWKCGSCGGSGVYLNRHYDKTRPVGEQLVSENVTCTVCQGSGDNPIARAALFRFHKQSDGRDLG